MHAPVIDATGLTGQFNIHWEMPQAKPGDTQALAAAIEELSGKKLAMLGSGASQMAGELYAWPRVFERLFCIYREVCANYKGNGQG